MLICLFMVLHIFFYLFHTCFTFDTCYNSITAQYIDIFRYLDKLNYVRQSVSYRLLLFCLQKGGEKVWKGLKLCYECINVWDKLGGKCKLKLKLRKLSLKV